MPLARLAVPGSAEPQETSEQRKCLSSCGPPSPWDSASFSFLWVNPELLLRPSCIFISVGEVLSQGPARDLPGVVVLVLEQVGVCAKVTGREGSAGTLTVMLNTSGLLTDMLKCEKWLLMQIIVLVRTCYQAQKGNLMHGLLFSQPPCTK